jgi:integrase
LSSETPRKEHESVVNLVTREPELRLSTAGDFQFALPLSSELIERFRGSMVSVRVDGLAFDVTVDEVVPIPTSALSLQEAKYFAAAISFQVLANLHELDGGRDMRPEPGIVSVVPTMHVGDMIPRGGQSTGRVDLAVPEPDSQAVTFARLFDLWSRHHLAVGGAPTTPPYWRTLVNRFEHFLGHDDPARVTAHDVRAYRDHLIQTGRHVRTARDSDLAALRSLFRFGLENDLVPQDPTHGVRVRSGRLVTSRKMLAFSDEEAAIILKAADCERIASRRWIPWLTALTGSRVATMVNLRREDVVCVDGIWCVKVSRKAGPVKTAASERLVPLHPALIERGFIAFVQSGTSERLFIRSYRKVDSTVVGEAGADPYYPGRTTYNRMTEWIHSLGLEIGRSAGKDPNHAWRHWFKEKAFSVGIPEKITDAIVGHAQISAARRYGNVTLGQMHDALCQVPVPAPNRNTHRNAA